MDVNTIVASAFEAAKGTGLKVRFKVLSEKEVEVSFLEGETTKETETTTTTKEKETTKILSELEDTKAIRITEILYDLGIPAHLKGFQYIRTAILKAVYEVNMLNSVTKTLYPEVAKEYNTTPSRVERGIRHAIEVSSSRGNIENLEKMFGYTISAAKGKPTNSEFIALITDKILLELKR